MQNQDLENTIERRTRTALVMLSDFLTCKNKRKLGFPDRSSKPIASSSLE